MKRIVTLFFLPLLLLCCSQPASAQFFKKLFGGGNDKPHTKKSSTKKGGKNAVTGKPAPPKKKSHSEQLAYPATQLKDHYRIDILAPLYLNELVSGNKKTYKEHPPEKALPGINFYEGIRLAADTLDAFGYRMDIYVHDITDVLTSTETLLHTDALDSADLIIGAVPAAQVPVLAQFAKKHTINFVSVLSPADGGVKGNAWFTLMQPTLQAHCEWIRKAIAKKYNKASNIIVYHRAGIAVDEASYKTITANAGFPFAQAIIRPAMKRDSLVHFLDSNTTNVIVMPVLSETEAEPLLQQLATDFPAYRFEVYGMPSWKGMSLLRKEDALPNVAVYFTSPFYFDPSTTSSQALAAVYGKKFGGKPGEWVYRGYETMYWYAYLLQHYGNVFNPKMSDNNAASFTRFDVAPRWDKDDELLYNENDHLYLYRFQSGNMMVEQ